MASVQAPIEFVTPNKRYAPVGYCIYCLTHSNLTKEHIIPHGLAGNSLVLPESSCTKCAAKTRDWETACLRHLWWPFRTRIGATLQKTKTRKLYRQADASNRLRRGECHFIR